MERDSGQQINFWKKSFQNKVLLLVLIALAVIVIGTGATLKASDKPAFCTNCHIMNTYYKSYSESNLLANKHAKAGLVCHDCHETSITAKINEGIKYITNDFKTPMKQRRYSKELCLKCHNDFDKIIEKTQSLEEANPHESHFGSQECYECHSMHRQSNVMCSRCHQFPWYKDLDSSWKQSGK
ncbi:putative multiheme cytochrome c [Thermincola ferriacetica]|uniref:Tetrahaem cytochrome domain-containing protein n=2 Tax=Thermincola TaxID=278993 RepID=D5X9Q0_THEPJ|nr:MULTISPECIES: cytochrome c3 [Thermincola]ADG81121.1 hypothetical protein TherJR_0233 [Thermincola potens JR]KNZ68479.1 putative multiheme cytochrome c [Thermincola ferriacetica]